MLTPEELRAIKAAKRSEAEACQTANSHQIGPFTLRPAIGRTGGADSVGWELHRDGAATKYYGTKEQAEAATWSLSSESLS